MCTTTPLYLRGRHGGRYINNPPCYSYANALYDNKWNANHQTLYRLEEFADSQRGAHGGSFLFRKLLKNYLISLFFRKKNCFSYLSLTKIICFSYFLSLVFSNYLRKYIFCAFYLNLGSVSTAARFIIHKSVLAFIRKENRLTLRVEWQNSTTPLYTRVQKWKYKFK